MIITNDQSAALKEWASAIQELESGRQIVIMRKGGIVEETNHFVLRNMGFYLFPTYEHQKKHLLKPSKQSLIDLTMQDWDADIRTVSITSYAEAIDDVEIFSQEELDRIKEHHIWTDEFAVERLKWKKKQPLHVILLKVYKLVEAMEVDIRPEFIGCKSWIDLPSSANRIGYDAKPVLSDEQFEAQRAAILQALGRTSCV